MPKKQDRFVNNELLGLISRPQFEFSCSLSSFIAEFNYQYSGQLEIKMSQSLMRIVDTVFG